MAWWGKLIGGTVGFIFGGPLGAILGASMGHGIDKAKEEEYSRFGFDGSERIQTVFFTATFSVMGYVAKADGAISQDEIAAVESIMAHMQLGADQRRTAINLFRQGKNQDFPLDDVLNQFVKECHRSTNLIRMFVEMLVITAMADGELHQTEKRILLYVCDRVGYPRDEFERIVRTSQARQRSGKRGDGLRGNEPSHTREAYDVLGVTKKASDEEVKKAYRRLLSQYHPDKLVSKGLPEEMMKFATEKTGEITRAYETIKEARNMR